MFLLAICVRYAWFLSRGSTENSLSAFLKAMDFNTYKLGPESLDVERFSNVTFNHLREIKIEGFIDTEHEMEFMKLLLAKSPVLVRMFVKFCRPVEESARAKMLARLSKVKRASPKAEVNFIFRSS
ncbi:PREDICTED: uncharacterized protein LOC109214783 [Nicotiana attenuata]|uniref:uncharacterized protein LOC109214783 n=1 Tax=Nicotiana attenuata TaxID=49451 RepID=UPI0009048B4E|nr:PREDICTED: uncharacterized protein LOC109214783 [Nicotiana attenuata]